jgi:gliding motility-associated protein GldM
MAGGNLSPRQKMINLMYLVFIAMLALNMSKEVLSAFGLMNERLTEANLSAAERNTAYLASLTLKAQENEARFAETRAKAEQIAQISDDFSNYLQGIKDELVGTVKEQDVATNNFEVMDKPDHLNTKFFRGTNLTEEGQEFKDRINKFREDVLAIIGDEYPKINADLDKKFKTDDVKRKRDGKTVEWLSYHYEGFPMIASLTKLTQMQADVKATNSEIFSRMLEGELTGALSMTNYGTILQSSKSAYFQGEPFDGAVVLGRTDETTRPNRVELTLDGRPLTEDQYTIQGGRVVLNVNAGNAGEHKIGGNLIFEEGGEETPVPVDLSFTTISKPTDAVISADKMNVVYRGVPNPLTISMPGVTDNNINATASSGILTKASGGSKYTIDVTKAQGREVTINVSGTIDGTSYPSKATFRIKDIPAPVGTVRGEDGITSMQKNNLQISTIGASLPDFDFDLNLQVTGFKFKVPGQPTINVNGNKLDSRAIDALNRARRGETVQIFDIEARIAGNTDYKLQKVSPVLVELTN